MTELSAVAHHGPLPGRELTPRQKQFLQTIVQLTAESGRSPTIRELMTFFEVGSPNAVSGHIHALQKKGMLEKTAAGERPRSRYLKLTPAAVEMVGLVYVSFGKATVVRPGPLTRPEAAALAEALTRCLPHLGE